jgi:hypothetical protein
MQHLCGFENLVGLNCELLVSAKWRAVKSYQKSFQKSIFCSTKPMLLDWWFLIPAIFKRLSKMDFV